MTVLVCGGAASGKSAYAEKLLCKLSGNALRIYLATMRPFGVEAAARIERHRAQREGRGFQTFECYVNLSSLELPPDSAVLLEDIGNLCANEMFDPAGSGEAADAVVHGVEALRRQCRHLVIVSNEVSSGGADYAGDTRKYLRVLGEVNRRLAALSKGLKQRVSLARVLIPNPAILLLDEPAAGLDPRAKQRFLNLLLELRDKQGLTVVVVSHNMDDLAELCDYVLVLNEGRLFALGEPTTVFADERKLKDVGLGVPHAVHLANRLKNAGIELPISPVPSFDELASAIASRLAVQEGR